MRHCTFVTSSCSCLRAYGSQYSSNRNKTLRSLGTRHRVLYLFLSLAHIQLVFFFSDNTPLSTSSILLTALPMAPTPSGGGLNSRVKYDWDAHKESIVRLYQEKGFKVMKKEMTKKGFSPT